MTVLRQGSVPFLILMAMPICFRQSYGFFLVPGSGMSYMDDAYSDCDYFTELAPGNEYYIANPTYPKYYVTDTRCRWVNLSPNNTRIQLKCYVIDLSQSADCVADSVQVSLCGDLYMSDATKYCGKQSFEETSQSNKLVVTLEGMIMGKLLCAMKILDNKPVPVKHKENKCQCGKKYERHNRIVNGYQTQVNEYPFMAGLVMKSSKMLFCGASIVAKRWALSAAHCKESRVTNQNTILLVGDHNLGTEEETDATQRVVIKKFHVYEGYSSRTAKNDLLLIELDKDIIFSERVMPICLPHHLVNHNFEYEDVIVLGWGTTSFGGPTSKVLMETTLKVRPISECQAAFAEVTEKQLCTYGKNTDACQADSGGPLIYYDGSKKRWFLVGLISYGRGCADDVPAVNTRLPCRVYLDWVIGKVYADSADDSCAPTHEE